MFDAILLAVLKEAPRGMSEALPVLWAFAKANPLSTALLIGALMIGGGSGGRRRSVPSRIR